MTQLAHLIDRHGVEVLPNPDLDLSWDVPVLTGLQRQGDVIVIPDVGAHATTAVTQNGTPVVRGESGGNTHAIYAEGTVFCDLRTSTVRDLTVATLTVAEGAVAYLAHPEHGFQGIGPGSYTIRRQREMADELRVVAD